MIDSDFEEWRAIPGYEGVYEVSNQGRVRSLDRVYTRPFLRFDNVTIEVTVRHKGKVLSPGPQRSGHLTVALGKGNSKLVHALVMLAFEGPYPEGMEILHKNHDPSDNRHSNLKYGTRTENMFMDYEAGIRKKPVWLAPWQPKKGEVPASMLPYQYKKGNQS